MKKKREFTMNDSQKEKYAELFTAALDTMEGAEWKKPWVSPNMGAPCNLYRRNTPYRKSNAFWLSMLCEVMGWNTPYFITKTDVVNEDGTRKYKGLSTSHVELDENGMMTVGDDGMPVMKHERRFPVFFFKPLYKDKDGNKLTDEEYRALTAEEKDECKVSFYRTSYMVWNIDQTNIAELYPEDYEALKNVPKHEYEHGIKDEVLERMIMQDWICPVKFGGHSAHYDVTNNFIRLPERSAFVSDERFYATALHEMAHSTKAEMKRELDTPYEEFVAELTAACVGSILGIGKLLDEQHLVYVDSWRHALRGDKDFIPKVIDYVQYASNFILRKYDAVAKKMQQPLLLEAA